MQRAIELALDNVRSGGGGPFAAVVVREGKIVGEGVNRVTANHDPTAHAEVNAIRAACRALGHFELKGCEIYTTCEPCPMCLGAIYWARLKAVYFAGSAEDAASAGFDDRFIGEQMNLPPGQRKIPVMQMMREEALEVFRAWVEKPDRVPY